MYELRDLWLFLWASTLSLLEYSCLFFVEPWLTIGIRISIQLITIWPYTAISFTMMTFLRKVLISSVCREHMSCRLLRHMVHYQKLNFLLMGNKLLRGNFCFFVHGALVKSYSFHILKHLHDFQDFIQYVWTIIQHTNKFCHVFKFGVSQGDLLF